MKLTGLSAAELLTLHADVADELRHREITRSSNNPAGDYAEYLFCKAFGWVQADNSVKSFDATDPATKMRYQIKSRRLTAPNTSRQLSALRNLKDQGFDYLAGLLFDRNYGIERAALIPYDQVLKLSKYGEHTNSWRFMLRDSVWLEAGVIDVSDKLRAMVIQ
ncbi:hypothetical protein [Novosphingobium humi]|uniref:Restriction endonuclease n=1 Tax=Novosphingobium humi TaxID=2282397 RepID=A0ABY7TTT3_9SPHN|nr:hypothetical protein [Novosphingobium humi]WCT76416.1 hypothetical protein PQ457_10725 [Novosphingobium humi]